MDIVAQVTLRERATRTYAAKQPNVNSVRMTDKEVEKKTVDVETELRWISAVRPAVIRVHAHLIHSRWEHAVRQRSWRTRRHHWKRGRLLDWDRIRTIHNSVSIGPREKIDRSKSPSGHLLMTNDGRTEIRLLQILEGEGKNRSSTKKIWKCSRIKPGKSLHTRRKKAKNHPTHEAGILATPCSYHPKSQLSRAPAEAVIQISLSHVQTGRIGRWNHYRNFLVPPSAERRPSESHER
ncbi:hypothetical protein K491DRAFT_333594 [Lophiostoma macrostomum CBS 122681]|uniref:Uncharacterized protein n=1 Tax=Lophiostoma macrostomum CBS 122681 TaxID=1314788 RepID=A0A6A6TSH7_9PLEO|nr:hypothetical protein K491DRAFT_333594 [Lophiostoma macrostomum CBS 122681]